MNDRLKEKADKLRQMGHKVSTGFSRPALGTQGLTVNDAPLDEQLIDRLIAGEDFSEVARARELWIKGERSH